MKTIAFAAIATSACLSNADIFSSRNEMDYSASTSEGIIWPHEITIDVSGMQFNDAPGSALNHVLSIFIGQGQVVGGIAWDVNLTTIGASWASEATLNFEGQIVLAVADDPNPVSNMNYSSNGFVFLADSGLPDIVVGPDGVLDIEFYESFVDNGGTGDAFFEPGSTITITNVPTPGALAIFGLGGLFTARRRR